MSDRIQYTKGTRASEASSCEGKIPFDNQTLALKAAKRRVGRTVYRCRHCHDWHVGTPDPKPKKYEKRSKLIRLFLQREFVDD